LSLLLISAPPGAFYFYLFDEDLSAFLAFKL